MLSLTATAVNTPHLRSSTFLPTFHPTPTPPPPHHHHRHKPFSISALILPNSSSSKQQQLYQPFRPPPSPIPPQFRSLDINGRLEVLTNRLGIWYQYAPLIPALIQEGFTPSTLEEITGIPSREQNRLEVAAQVRDSLVQATDDETVAFFDSPNAPEILYAIRFLNTPQRAAAARFIIANEFDAKRAEELSRSMKDFHRRQGDRGWECFDQSLPGDCLGYMYYRQAQEHKTASSLELSKAALERAYEVVESDRAKERVLVDLEGREGEGSGDGSAEDELVRVPVVRMSVGEVAESSVVAVLPVCRAEMREAGVEAAPWGVAMKGDFGVVEAEKEWGRWVVLPGWTPVAVLKEGGVAVLFPKARGILPWKNKRRDTEEQIVVVADRGRKAVEYDDGFYLVVGGGNGSGAEGLKVERGVKLKEMGVEESLGTVVLVVRPPRDEEDAQLGDEDWV